MAFSVCLQRVIWRQNTAKQRERHHRLLPRDPHSASRQQTARPLSCVWEHLGCISRYLVHPSARCVRRYQKRLSGPGNAHTAGNLCPKWDSLPHQSVHRFPKQGMLICNLHDSASVTLPPSHLPTSWQFLKGYLTLRTLSRLSPGFQLSDTSVSPCCEAVWQHSLTHNHTLAFRDTLQFYAYLISLVKMLIRDINLIRLYSFLTVLKIRSYT